MSEVAAFCRRLLLHGELEAKLAPPRGAGGALLRDAPAAAPLSIARPARAGGLALRSGAPRLPGRLDSAEARARCLARFAHHELMAAELLAWALLRWPDAPARLRRSWLHILEEEQIHCRLYLERLTALGSDLAAHPTSGYFWRQVPVLDRAPAGPRAFLCALGLTLEQANLDKSARYRDAFRAAGDEPSARVCQRVYDDEVRHVGAARRELLALDARGGAARAPGDLDAYLAAVPFPFSPARAKGRPFDRAARRRAGLSEAFIDAVQGARASAELASAAARPASQGPGGEP